MKGKSLTAVGLFYVLLLRGLLSYFSIMYKELQDYLLSLGASHVDVTTTILSHDLANANKYKELTGSVLQVDPLSGTLNGDEGEVMHLTQYLTLGINTVFKSGDDHNKTTEGYHAALETSYDILMQFLAKMEYDVEQEECPLTEIAFGQIKTFESETVAGNWAMAAATIPYTIYDVINYNEDLWE